jgi:hypothetical protein
MLEREIQLEKEFLERQQLSLEQQLKPAQPHINVEKETADGLKLTDNAYDCQVGKQAYTHLTSSCTLLNCIVPGRLNR